jgi:hypothetical protein
VCESDEQFKIGLQPYLDKSLDINHFSTGGQTTFVEFASQFFMSLDRLSYLVDNGVIITNDLRDSIINNIKENEYIDDEAAKTKMIEFVEKSTAI